MRGAARRAASHGSLPALVVVAGFLALLPFTRHHANPDGPAYVLVAERWLAGDLPAAVNAYWGPLFSWAAAPLLAVGVDGLLALRLVLLAGALLCLPPLRRLARRAGAGPTATTVLLVGTAPLLVHTALFGLYPDVLLAAVLLRLVDLLTRPAFVGRAAVALEAGAWAGAAYLTKAYGLAVVVVVLPCAVALRAWLTGEPRAALLRALALATAAFLLVAGSWVAVLSVAYGAPTWSTSAGFNADLVAPGSAGNPFNVPGLHEPTRPDAVSGWEEPSRLPIPTRSGFEELAPADDPGGAVLHRLELAVANARIVVGSVVRRGLPIAALAAVALVAAVRERRRPSPALAVPVLTAAVAAGGLLPSIAIERYLWVPILLLVPAAAVGLEHLRRWRPSLLAPLALAVVAGVTAGALHGLAPRFGAHLEVTRAAVALERDGGLAGRVAAAGSWQETHLLCWRLDCQYLGRPLAEQADEVARELAAADVDRLVVWDRDRAAIAGLPPPPGPGGPDALTVYTVEDATLVVEHRVDGGRPAAAPVQGPDPQD